MDSFLSQA